MQIKPIKRFNGDILRTFLNVEVWLEGMVDHRGIVLDILSNQREEMR